jgi:hypothetical protein
MVSVMEQLSNMVQIYAALIMMVEIVQMLTVHQEEILLM